MSVFPGEIETEISEDSVMKVKPVVSVLMATYNHENYIAEAIEGVVCQRADFSFELIIGEDCSSDGTRDIVLEYQKRFPHIIRVVYSNKNIGAFNNVNRIFKRARGQFVAWCEGDDFWIDRLKLQKQVNYLRERPEYCLVHTDYHYLVFNFGKWRLINSKLRPRKRKVKEGNVYEYLLKNMFIRTCTMMGRSDVLKQHFNSGLRSSKHPVGDRPLVLHLSKLGMIGYIDEATAVYRRTPSSMINSGFESLVKIQKGMQVIYESFLDTYGREGIVWPDVEANYYKTLLSFCFRAGMRDEFLLAKSEAEKYVPKRIDRLKYELMGRILNYSVTKKIVILALSVVREVNLFRLSMLSKVCF